MAIDEPQPPPRNDDQEPKPPGAPPDLTALAERAAKEIARIIDRALPAAERASEEAKRVGEDVQRRAIDFSQDAEKALARLREEAEYLMKKGQHTRVRIHFRGKQVADMPIAAVAAAEAASFLWFGPLRLILGNLVGKAVLDVEFISNADPEVKQGRERLADGDLDGALEAFDRALAMDKRCASAHLGRGVAFKLRGDKEAARKAFERAAECDPTGETGNDARRHLGKL